MENFTLVTRGDATFAQIAQRPTHGECDCGCAAPFRGLVLDYKYTTGLNTLQVYIHFMEGERGGVRKKINTVKIAMVENARCVSEVSK